MMELKWYADPATGECLGSYQDGTPCRVPGAVETPQPAWSGQVWDGKQYVEPPPIHAERAEMRATRMQLALALGPVRWQAILDYAANEAPWNVRIIVENTVDVPRISATVELLAWVLEMTPEQTDDLFRLAMTIVE